MDNRQKKLLWIIQGAVIAALYVALTVTFAPISYNVMQIRISEALTILPMFASSAVPGLFIGCLLANLLGGAVLLDVIAGSLATLIGAVGGYLLRKNRWLVPIPSILSNAVIIPFVLRHGYGLDMPLWTMGLYIAAGEIVGCYVLGQLLATALLRHGDLFAKLKRK